jgi:hypothetical protein
MKWVENAYCLDNGNFTGGIYGVNVKGKLLAYYRAEELGKFSKIADAQYAIEKAYSKHTGEPMPVKIPIGPLASRM